MILPYITMAHKYEGMGYFCLDEKRKTNSRVFTVSTSTAYCPKHILSVFP